MKKQIQITVVIEVEEIEGEQMEVATAYVHGTGVRGVCQVIGGGVDTETKAAEAARAAVRKHRGIIGDDLTEELTQPKGAALRAVETQGDDYAPDSLLGCIAGR